MSIARRSFKNVAWLLAGEIGSKGLLFLGTAYLARVLGKAGFGLFSLSLAMGVYLWIIADLGVTGYGTREIARDRTKTTELYSVLNSLRLAAAAVLLLVLCGAVMLLDMPTEERLIFIAGGSYVLAFALSPEWVLRGMEQTNIVALGNVVVALLFVGGCFLLVKNVAGALWAALAYSGSFLAGSLLLMAVVKRTLGIPFAFRFRPGLWLLHLRESWYFGLNTAFNSITVFIPLALMGLWCSADEIGAFSAPHWVAGTFIKTGGMIVLAMYPVLAALYYTDKDAFRRTHAGFQKTLLWILMPLCVAVTLFSRETAVLLFGEPYADSAALLTGMLWLSFLIVMRFTFSNALQSADFQRFCMTATGAGAAMVVVSGVLLVPRFGGAGAVGALLGGEAVVIALVVGLFWKKLGSPEVLGLPFLKILCVSCAVGVMLKMVPLPALPGAVVGIIAYGSLSIATGIIRKDTFRALVGEFGRNTSDGPVRGRGAETMNAKDLIR